MVADWKVSFAGGVNSLCFFFRVWMKRYPRGMETPCDLFRKGIVIVGMLGRGTVVLQKLGQEFRSAEEPRGGRSS